MNKREDNWIDIIIRKLNYFPHTGVGCTFKDSMFHGLKNKKKELREKKGGLRERARELRRRKKGRRLADSRLHSRFRGSRIQPELRSLGLIVT